MSITGQQKESSSLLKNNIAACLIFVKECKHTHTHTLWRDWPVVLLPDKNKTESIWHLAWRGHCIIMETSSQPKSTMGGITIWSVLAASRPRLLPIVEGKIIIQINRSKSGKTKSTSWIGQGRAQTLTQHCRNSWMLTCVCVSCRNSNDCFNDYQGSNPWVLWC